jgi:hypothetical protein
VPPGPERTLPVLIFGFSEAIIIAQRVTHAIYNTTETITTYGGLKYPAWT